MNWLVALKSLDAATISMIRWGIPREPAWVNGTAAVAPAASAVLVTKTVTTAKTGRVFGIHISADEANQFDLFIDSAAKDHYVMASGGTLDIVLASPIQDGIVAGKVISIQNVVAGGASMTYQASLLYDEAA
jgi:hypothetical protein